MTQLFTDKGSPQSLLRNLVLAEKFPFDEEKTALMMRLERKFGCGILELIRPVKGITGETLSRRLGIADSTLSDWRKRFGITDTQTVTPGPKKLSKV